MPGFIDGLKKATGIGLSPQELYQLGFDEGVLKRDLSKACEYFHKAAEKAQEKGDPDLATRAKANHAIYQLLQLNKDKPVLNPVVFFPVWKMGSGNIKADYAQRKDPQGQMKNAIEADDAFMQASRYCGEAESILHNLKTIEKPYSADQTGNPQKLEAECKALCALFNARRGASADDYMAAQAVLEKTPDGDEMLLGVPPSILALICSGHAQFLQGMELEWKNPDRAGETIGKAMQTFEQVFAKADVFQAKGFGSDFSATEIALRQRANELQEMLCSYAKCQLCDRQLQGKGVHYHIHKIHISTYNAQVAGLIPEDRAETETKTHDEYEISVCESCCELIDRLAEPVAVRKANEALDLSRKYTDERVEKIVELLRSLDSRLSRVEARVSALSISR